MKIKEWEPEFLEWYKDINNNLILNQKKPNVKFVFDKLQYKVIKDMIEDPTLILLTDENMESYAKETALQVPPLEDKFSVDNSTFQYGIFYFIFSDNDFAAYCHKLHKFKQYLQQELQMLNKGSIENIQEYLNQFGTFLYYRFLANQLNYRRTVWRNNCSSAWERSQEDHAGALYKNITYDQYLTLLYNMTLTYNPSYQSDDIQILHEFKLYHTYLPVLQEMQRNAYNKDIPLVQGITDFAQDFAKNSGYPWANEPLEGWRILLKHRIMPKDLDAGVACGVLYTHEEGIRSLYDDLHKQEEYRNLYKSYSKKFF